MFKKFLENYFYILIYIVLIAVTILRIFSYENAIKKDNSKISAEDTYSIECIVVSIPKTNGDTVSFNAKILSGVKIKNYAHVSINYAEKLEVCLGDKLHFKGKAYNLPDGLNPGGFSYKDYLKSQGASVGFKSTIYRISKHEKSYLAPIYRLRNNIAKKAFTYFPKDEASLVNALVTGSKDEMTEDLKENYRKAGVYHIIAVSGLHLNLIIMFLSVIYLGFRRYGRTRSILAFLVTLACSLFVLLFTGLGVSVRRAAIMSVALCSAIFVGREYSPFASLFVALIAVVNLSPGSYADISMQLSFSATAGVLFGVWIINKYDFRKYKLSGIYQSIIITSCANLFTMPFVIYSFGYVSSVSLFSNLIIIPFTAFLLGMSYLFAICSVFMPEFLLKIIANITVVPAFAVNFITKSLAKIPFSYIAIPAKIFYAVLLFTLIFVVIMKMKRGKVLLSSVLIVANIFSISYNTYKRDCEVTFINVGQGDCALISASDGVNIMIDCGSESHSNIAENEIIPYLRRQNVHKIDALFVTHYHEDHVNGICDLINNGYVKSLVLPDRLPVYYEKENAFIIYEAASKKNVPIKHVSKDDTVTINDHKFDILNPDTNYTMEANDASMVIKYTYGKTKVLFTGDIEYLGQYLLIDQVKDIDIVKVAHHGGQNAFNGQLAKKLSGKYAVISCGENNKYKHPHDDTLKAFKEYKILRTDKHGPIKLKIN